MVSQTSFKNAIEIKDLSFAYPNSDQPTIAISEFSVHKGERVLMMGPSGSGKTTLLNLVVGMLSPFTGSIQVVGQELGDLSARQRDRFRAKHIGVIFQSFNLVPYLTAMDNIKLAQHFAGIKKSNEHSQSLLQDLGLPESHFDKKVRELSIGQQQRVAIARALVNQPEVLIADEPSSALDQETRDQFLDLLVQQCQQNDTALIMVSHDATANHWFDRVVDFSTLNQIENVIEDKASTEARNPETRNPETGNQEARNQQTNQQPKSKELGK